MNRLQLYRLIRHNNHLGYRRSPAWEQSMVAKVMMGIGGTFFVFYLLLYGIMMAVVAIEDHEPTMLVGVMPLMLVVDFGLRFMVQQTPAMLIKPYLLLPLPVKALIEDFLLSSVLSVYNWLWLAFFLPYAIIICAGGYGLGASLAFLSAGMLLLMANSQFYLMVRTLVARHILWWALPVLVYGGYWSLLLVDEKGSVFAAAMDWLVDFGQSPWFLLASLLLLVGLLLLNRTMQLKFVYEEVSRQEKETSVKMEAIWQLGFFNRFGEMGEYLKLEVKSIFRCKALRSRFIMSVSLVLVLSLLIAYSEIYDNLLMLNFWCYYCFAIYSATSLVKIMGAEGNYIDLLMVQRENILQLLRAKYYFQCAILVVPFIVMLPAVIAGKFSLLMMVSYLLLCSGLLFFILFQLAVYNKQTLPLDQKLTGKGNMENGLQLILEFAGLLLPIFLLMILLLMFSEETAYVIVGAVGLVFTVFHPLWLRNVYRRMMVRKYENLEGFHATR